MVRFGGLVLVMLAVCCASGASAQEEEKRAGVWAQAYVAGRPADPSVRFGQLENGMRYAIRRNATPLGHTSLRMWIGAGSLDETEAQRGLAHFLEHLAFRGSGKVPTGEMVKVLQRLGLAFGADTNARTGFDQTVYQFDLPKSDAQALGTGLMLLREIASELTLDQGEMDAERGVVLAEERSRDTPGLRHLVAELGFHYEGQLAARRLPIGLTEVIRAAPVSLVRAFYEARYRPDNAAVVAVGDFDVDAMERMIRASFGGWVAKEGGRPGFDAGAVLRRGPAVRVLMEPRMPASVSLAWMGPYDRGADTAARQRRYGAEALAVAVLNRRLERVAQEGEAPFLMGNVGRSNALRSARMTQVRVQPRDGAWQPALEAAIQAQRALVAFGARPEEIERVMAETRRGMRIAAGGEATRASARIADSIVAAVNHDAVYTSPAQDMAEIEGILAGITAEEVQAAARGLFEGSGPLVFVAGPPGMVADGAAVAAVLTGAMEKTLVAAVAQGETGWPYALAARAGAIAERGRIEALDAEVVRFANGVRLIVKRTDFAREDVRVRVRIGEGRLGVPQGLAGSLWQVTGSVPLLRYGGTRELAYEAFQRLTVDNRIGLDLSMDDDAFLLDGATRPADFERQMEWLEAMTRGPGMRAAAFERMRGALLNQAAQRDATASGVLGRILGPALRGGDMRWQAVPDAEGLAQARAEDLAALIGPAFAAGPIEIVVVGDIAVERAIDGVARSFGTMPAQAVRKAVDPRQARVRFPPAGTPPLEARHAGRSDQAVAVTAWPTVDFFADPPAQRALGVMAAILQGRLTDRLRSAEGMTYSPQASAASSEVFPGLGYVYAMLELPVDKVATFYGELEQFAAALRDAPPTADELERAKRPRVNARIRMQRENGYWLGALSGVMRDPRSVEAVRDLVAGAEGVSASDVQAVARRFLVDEAAFRVIVRPAVR